MEPGPLPPHERSWRHPSELGPTRVDVDESGSRHQFAALLTGGVMIVALAVMVVAVTPRGSSSPVAVSATTTPIGTVVSSIEPPAVTERRPAGIVASNARFFAASVSASPHAITSSPELTLDGADVAPDAPDDDDVVRVRTDAVTYELPWAMVEALQFPDGAVVFDLDGGIVAHVARGEFVELTVD